MTISGYAKIFISLRSLRTVNIFVYLFTTLPDALERLR